MKVVVDAELEEIFPAYLNNREKDMAELKSSLLAEDFEQMRHIGHKIVGNAAGYGLESLSDYSRQLEESAKKGNLSGCKDAIKNMEGFLSTLELVFE